MKLSDLTKQNIPDTPGVYFFMLGTEIIYIGKATSLKSRTRSYFSKDLIQTRGPMIVDMVFKADGIKWEKTDTVLEALILEANAIKKYKPRYNVKEKDNKSFNYVCITKESIPRILIIRGREIDFKTKKYKDISLDTVYGPYTSGSMLREALKIIRKIFPFIDKESTNQYTYEFYRQLGLTPDFKNEATMAYKKTIRHLKLFFSGKKKEIIKSLEKEMHAYAKVHKFEEAQKVKKTLFSLNHINDIALLKHEQTDVAGGFRIESYDIAHMQGSSMVGVMTVLENGEVNKKEYRKFLIKGFTKANDPGALTEILTRRLKHTEWKYPDLFVVDGGMIQYEAFNKVLKDTNLSIPIVSVVKNERHVPKALMGDQVLAKKYKQAILLSNSEAHRFAITFHRTKERKRIVKR